MVSCGDGALFQTNQHTGTKSDLASGTSVKLEDAKYIQEKYNGYATVECSAKTGSNMKVVGYSFKEMLGTVMTQPLGL